MDSSLRNGITEVSFGTYTKEEIESTSVLEITGTKPFDNSGKPKHDGFYDSRLGPTEGDESCPICGQHSWHCVGHFGHIPLSRPVYHPLYITNLKRLLSGICLECHCTRMPKAISLRFLEAMKLISHGIPVEFNVFDDSVDLPEIPKLEELGEEISQNSVNRQKLRLINEYLARISKYRYRCANCQHNKGKVVFIDAKNEFAVEMDKNDKDKTYISIDDIRHHLDVFWENNQLLFTKLFSPVGPKMFFIDTIFVTPSQFRPPSYLGQKVSTHPIVNFYADILNCNKILLKDIEEGTSESVRSSYQKLQAAVNTLMDNSGTKTRGHGIRQILEKKDGVFRKNLMGKRVNFSARSVIAPDPYIATDEIGVPQVFAMTLSYPEKVTDSNRKRLYDAIINGPKKYPGANFIANCYGTVYHLAGMKDSQRTAYAKQVYQAPDGPYPMTVGRHLINGDYVLLNRQPTLHRVSIMGMKARVLPNQKTIRMHYANCASFNADFDGDEINLHFPQSEMARAEVANLSLSSIHYVTPTAGAPIRGMIQDHIDSAVLISLNNRFFTLDRYQELVFTAFGGSTTKKLKWLHPAIVYPKQFWTGKQLISTLILNLIDGKPCPTVTSKSKFTPTVLHPFTEETDVLIMDGQLMTGILDKNQFGASSYGLVHSIYELYGSAITQDFLTMLSRLFTFFMQTHGLTCGIADMITTRRSEHFRRHSIKDAQKVTDGVISKFLAEFGTGQGTPEDQMYKLLRDPQMKKRFDNMMKAAVQDISSSINSKIFPMGLYKPFPLNNLMLMCLSGAKGSSVNLSQISCLLGQQELEGKRVPLMSSGKTLPSFDFMDLSPEACGYVTGRFLTGLTPQQYYFHCMAGREGLTDTAVKTASTGYLQRCLIKNVESVHVAYDGTVRDSDDTIIQFIYGGDGIDPMHSQFLDRFPFIEQNLDAYLAKHNINDIMEKADCDTAMKALEDGEQMIQSKYQPNKYIGSISPRFKKDLEEYQSTVVEKSKLQDLAVINYFNSQIEAGETVGIVASQALGEPATQMTLNTFHLAGYGGTNVTLGIPRLQEILIVATRKPATPTMTIHAKDKSLLDVFKRVSLHEIVKSYTISERIQQKTDVRRQRILTVKVSLLEDKLPTNQAERLLMFTRLRHAFATILRSNLNKISRQQHTKVTSINDDELQNEVEIDPKAEEMGADREKRLSRKQEKASYEADNDVEETKEEVMEEQESESEEIEESSDPETAVFTVSFAINDVSMRLLVSTHVEDAMKRVMVHEVEGVTRAIIDKVEDNGEAIIQTEGVNYDAVINRDDVVCEDFYTNDIGVILQHLGIEAARAAIIKEAAAVFSMYGIKIDPRHLSLIADYVTNSGEWAGLNRRTIETAASIIQQMSFETTTHFLVNAVTHNMKEHVASPSASLALGNPVKMGTGICEVIMPFE